MAAKNSTEFVFTGNSGQLNTVINRVRGEMRGLGSEVKSSFTDMAGGFLNWQTAVVAGVGAVSTAFALKTKEVIDKADQIGKMSQKIGVPVETLSYLSYAADLSGVSIEGLQTSFKKLSEQLDDANFKGINSATAINRLGIATKNTDGTLKDAEAVFFDIAETMSKMPDGFEKTALAVDIFGKSGTDIIPLINSGKEGLQGLRTEAENLGLIYNEKLTRAAENVNDSMSRVNYAFEGVITTALNELSPAITIIADDLSDFFTESNNAQSIGKVLAYTVFGMKTAFDVFSIPVKFATEMMGNFGAAMYALVTGNFQVLGKIVEDFPKRLKDIGQAAGEDIYKIFAGEVFNVETHVKPKVRAVGGSSFADAVKNEIEKGNDKKDNEIQPISLNLGINNSFFSDFNNSLDSMVQSYRDYADKRLEINTEITTAEMINWLIMEGHAANVMANMGNAMSAIYEATGEDARAYFEIFKGIKIAETLVSTYSSVVKAFESQASIPFVGPYLGYVQAASALAFGIATVSQISQMQPGSRSGGSLNLPSGKASASPAGVGVGSAGGGGRNVSVSVQFIGAAPDKDKLSRELVPYIVKAVEDGVGR